MTQPPDTSSISYWQTRFPWLNASGFINPNTWAQQWPMASYPQYGPQYWKWPAQEQQWRPSYEPTFWENPVNVARAYWDLKSTPPGTEQPDWLAGQQAQIEEAYKYLSFINDDEDWTNWKYIHPDDPVRGFLQGLAAPPPENTLDVYDKQQWLLSELAQKPYQQWNPKIVSQLWPGYKQMMEQAAGRQEATTPPEQLPMWQQWALSIMQNPLTQGVAASLPLSVAGAIAGAPAGPLGIVAGAGFPLALGTTLSAAASQPWFGQKTAADLLKLLDYPAEWLEQGIGLGIQGLASATDPEAYGSLQEVLSNLGAAGQAGGLAYTTDAGVLIPNLFPAIEYVYRAVTGQDPDQVRFAEPGEVWQLGKAEPVKVDAYRAAALTNIRREIMAGADPAEVTTRYSEMFGFSGQLEEMVGHMVLDPLNVLPEMTTKGIGKVAEVAGYKPLALAAAEATGPINLWKAYRANIRAGIAGAADELSAFEKFAGGLNEMGVIKELSGDTPTSPIARAFAHIADLTPDAKARYFTGLMADNLGVALDRYRGDPDAQVKMIQALAKLDPHEAAAMGDMFGSPEMYTGQRAIATFADKAKELLTVWHAADSQRNALLRISQAIGESPADVLKMLATDTGPENVFRRLMNTAGQTASEAGRVLLEEAQAGRFTADDLKSVAKAFTGDKAVAWHPDEFQAQLWGGLAEHAADWSVAAYGVKPASPVFRFFDTLKRAQSLVLLGFNPAYFVNNAVNNVVTRAATGVFGFAGPETIARFIDRMGVEPYRFEAGMGVAGIRPEMEIGKIGKMEEAIGQPIGAVGAEGGEIPIRRAGEAHAGLLGKANDVLSAANKFAPFTNLSRTVESAESRQAFYFGMKKGWNGLWERGKGFERMPPAVEMALGDIDPRLPEIAYRVVEGSMNKSEVLAGLGGAAARYQIEQVLPDAAREVGLDLGVARDTLSPVHDLLREELLNARTPDDVRGAFQRIESQVSDHLDQMVVRELKTRAEQIASQVSGGGWAEALRVWDEQQFRVAEYWTQHFRDWEEAFTTAEELRMRGASQESINALFRLRSEEANRGWRRIRNFEKASIKGILEGLGTQDGMTRRYLLELENQHNRWSEFYNFKEEAYRRFFHTDYENATARNAAWADLENVIMEGYNRAVADTAEIGRSMDGLFVDIARQQFGEPVAAGAAKWRQQMQFLNDERARLMQAFREGQVGLPPDVRRGNWTSFLDETYMPFIQEFFRRQIEGFNDMYAAATGNDHLVRFTRELPPGEAPAAAPVQPTPPPPQPPAPEVARPPAPEAPPVETAPPPPIEEATPAVTTPERVGQLRQIAQEFGLASADETGKPVSGFDNHLLNIVKKYGGKEVASLDEVDPALLRASLELRQRAQEVETIARQMKTDALAQVQAEQGRQVDLVDQHNYVRMRELMESVERGAGGITQIGAGGEVIGRMARGYPKWYADLGNPKLGELSGVDAVIQALKDLAEGKRKLKRDGLPYVLYDKLAETGRRDFFKSYDDLVRAGLEEPIFDLGGWLDRITDIGSEITRSAEIYNPEYVASLYTRFLDLTTQAPEQIQREFMPTIQNVDMRFDALAESARRTEAARRLPVETAEHRSAREAVQEVEDLNAFQERIDASLSEKAPYPGTNPELPGLGAETLPLFSGTAQRATEAPFQPGPAEVQPVMPGMETAYRPQMEGAVEGGEAAGPLFTPGTTRLGPEIFQPLKEGEFMTARGAARIIGPDPNNPAQFIYELNGERKTMPYIQGAGRVPAGQMPLPLGQRPATGPIPPGAAEQVGAPEFIHQTEGDFWEQRVRPLLRSLEKHLKDSEQVGVNSAALPPDTARQFNTWLNGVYGDMATAKRAAMSWGENLRDQALLNYSKRRGFDNYLNILYPYQFWYTRSMWQWLQRAIDRPAWFANYGRIRDAFRNKMQTPGFPTRLRDKMAIPAPYLPEWAGGNLWVDPMRQLFPFEQFLSPIDDLAQRQTDDERTAQSVLLKMASDGKITQFQAQQAAQTKDGAVWQQALAEAQRQNEADEGGKMDLMSLVVQPALYLTLPYFLSTGKDPTTGRSDMPLLPMTRTGRTLSAITKGSPLEALGNLVGTLLAAPETALRRAKGISEFGDWGDYYIDRMLASMAGDGTITARDAQIAMTERSGPIFEEAMQRAQLEQSLRTPGAAPVYAGLHGGSPLEFAGATMFGWLPGGLLPEGEMEQRQLGELWKQARNQYNLGDTTAMNRFLEDHPEYEARLSLWDAPDERLRQFLISEVWDRYTALGSVEKQAARETLGGFFQRDFLDKETRNYDTLDVDTLATWTKMLGGYAPQTFETAAAQGTPAMLMPPASEATGVNAYRQERSQLFPNYYALQQRYFGLPEGSQERKDFLKRFPELKEYWDWNRAQKAANPNIEKYAGGGGGLDFSFLEQFSPSLVRQTIGHYYAGQEFSAGALRELQYLWNKAGKPGGSFDAFLNQLLKDLLLPQ